MVSRAITPKLLLIYTVLVVFIGISTFAVNVNVRVLFDRQIKPVYENVDLNLSLINVFSNVEPQVARIVHLISISKETTTRRVNEFTRDKNGSYVYFQGDYYQISDRRRYSYDSKQKKYVVDKDGLYVYLQEYAWARKQEDKYIMSDFYSLKSYTVTETDYYLVMVVTDIDMSTFFIKSITPVVSYGSTIDGAIRNAAKRYSQIVNEFSPDKIDIAILFEKGFNPILRTFILAKLQEDTRYNIYDRLYIDELMDYMRNIDLFGGESIALKFRPPKYLITFGNFVEKSEQTSTEEYYFFHNPINGAYIKRFVNGLAVPVRVEVGSYYRYDSSSKKYVFDIEKGNYVKYYKGPWEKDGYVLESWFYDYRLYNTTKVSSFYSFLANVFNTESGILVSSKFFKDQFTVPLKYPIDRFGSENTVSLTAVSLNGYNSIAENVQEFLQSIFPLVSAISDVEGLVVQLESGKNIGIKPGYVFQNISNGYTTGFLMIEKVLNSHSQGKIFYIVPGETIASNSLVIETKNYPYNTGGRFSLFIDRYGIGLKVGYIESNISGYYNWSLMFGVQSPYNVEEYYVTTVPVLFEFSKFLFGDNIELVLGSRVSINSNDLSGEIYISDQCVYFGTTLSSYVRNSVLSYGGTNFYASILYNLPFDNLTNLSIDNLNIVVGIDGRF
ncbi:hypothetical protein [Fervidobacterium sp.]